MNHQTETREYRAGDEVVLELTVDHEFELEGEVVAVFEHEGTEAGEESRGVAVIELRAGRRGLQQLRRSFHSAPPGKPDLTSTLTLRGRITAADALGEYRLAHVEAEYRGGGGRRMRFDLEGTDAVIRVVEDPVAAPRVTELRFR